MTPAAPPLRALILEDHVDDAEIMVMCLVDAGFQVTWSRVDTEAGFVAALRPELDVILADYTLPSFDVLHALARLAESELSVPFIVVSGTMSEETAVECLKRGAADYLAKDRLARLPTAVAAAVAARRLRDEQIAAVAALERTASELTIANEALRVADETKDQRLAITAHELRTPLTSILGYARLIKREWDGAAREHGREWVEIVEDQAQRMLKHVEDLLTLAAVELGAVQLRREPVALAAALSHAAAIAVPNGIAISCPGDLQVFADPVRLEQIITNLLANAVRHGGGAIRAEAHEDPSHRWVELRVHDQGPGVAPDFVPMLFDKFAQATARTPGDAGSGLGLAIVSSLTTAHNGMVWYEPEQGGACFAVRLPSPRVAQPSGERIR